MVKAVFQAPLRLDLCGGFTDVDEINKIIGTSIVNIAIDPYQDEQHSQKINFEISIDTNKAINISTLSEQQHVILKSLAEFYDGKVDFNCILNMNIDIPVSTGLGTSGTLSVLLVSAANYFLGNPKYNDFDFIFAEAMKFEIQFLKIRGGFQDYISAIKGGYNYIKKAKGKVKDFQIFNSRVDNTIGQYIEENVIIVYARRKFASNEILDDLLERAKTDPNTIFYLRRIKYLNEKFNKKYQNTSSSLKMSELFNIINSSSNYRDKLTNVAGSNIYLDILKQELKTFAYCSHSAGAGGGCLVVYGIPKYKKQIRDIFSGKDGVIGLKIFFPKINNNGLLINFF